MTKGGLCERDYVDNRSHRRWGKEAIFTSAFVLFLLICFLFLTVVLSFLAGFYLSYFPFTHLLSIQHMFFQRQKQSFLFNQKRRAGSRYFERNMKGWSGHSMLILDWTVAMAVLYSLSVFVCTWMCLWQVALLVFSSMQFQETWILQLGFRHCGVEIALTILEKGREEKNRILSSVDCISMNFMYWMHIPTPVMELVNTGYVLNCTSLPHSSVTHSTAPSACSARQEAPAGPH